MCPHPDLFDARHGCGRLFLIVDLLGVSFMDGSVLDPPCAAWEDCHERLGTVRVLHNRTGASPVFRAAGLLEHCPRYASAQDPWQGIPANRAAAGRGT
ncbi:STAS domain-containing protein [Streptomyces sp. NPDC050523]|uniref:STAS domain-containing protein n=1 Tax=Streptomyces sp. NPDC050523 TaxID=3365622 RepID=UPI0037A41462